MSTSVSEHSIKTDCRVYSGFKLTNLIWSEHEKINLKEVHVSYKTSYNLARYFLSIFHIAIA